ncbi:hypothetical protein CR513_02402, partial [Mucuna pruriens]
MRSNQMPESCRQPSNLHQEQEEKLLQVLRQHKKAIGWKLSDLPGINPPSSMPCKETTKEIEPNHPRYSKERSD